MSDWKAREEYRFAVGRYKRPVWANELWWHTALCNNSAIRDHYVHVSIDDPRLVAFTENAEKGALDRQTKVKPGRYLTRFLANMLTEEEIREYSGLHKAQHDKTGVQFATTPDEIEWVYLNGPSSCMSHNVLDYDTDGVHPVRVYGAGDLAVAYTLQADGDRVSSRVLCWPAKKIYSRVYGDPYILLMLQELGYNYDCDFVGAKLLHLENDNGDTIAPYIDGNAHCLEYHNNHLVIVRYSDTAARNTNGLLDYSGSTCDHCGNRMDDDESYCVQDESWCEHCYDNHASRCHHCEEAYHDDAVTYVESADASYCRSCLHEVCTVCDRCHEYHPNEDIVEVYTYHGNSRDLCEGCRYWLDVVECTECGEHHEPDSMELHLSEEHPGLEPEPMPEPVSENQLNLPLENAA